MNDYEAQLLDALARHDAKTHGGRRAGSGRKPRNTEQITLRLCPATIAKLKARAHQLDLTMSELVEKRLRRL